ncbi:hypothetical protein Neuguinea42_14370 [Helicobacter pylori]
MLKLKIQAILLIIINPSLVELKLHPRIGYFSKRFNFLSKIEGFRVKILIKYG